MNKYLNILIQPREISILIGCAVLAFIISFLLLLKLQEDQPLNEETRKNAPGEFVALSDGLTHYVVTGPVDGKPLVLIHGGGITGIEVWQHNIRYFSDHGYRVLAYDLFGRGYSDRLKTTYNPELFNRQLHELLQAINFPDSFNIVSMSMGSMVALDYAAQHPEAINSLVLIDPSATGDYKASRLLKWPVLSSMLMTFYWYPRAVENQRKEFVDQGLFESYATRLEYFMDFKGYKHVNHSTWLNTLTQSKVDCLKRLPANKVLLLFGDHDPYFKPNNLNAYQDSYPSISTASIENTGHMPHFEKPDEVNPIILEFLNKDNLNGDH